MDSWFYSFPLAVTQMIKNSYLDKSDGGFIFIYIIAVIVLLFTSRFILIEESSIGTEADIEARTRPVGQVRIAAQTEQSQLSLMRQDDEIKAGSRTINKMSREPEKGVSEDNAVLETVEISPAETLTVKQEIQPAVVADQAPGKGIYDSNCGSCHESGSENAPVTGDQNAFLASFSKGIDVLIREIKQGPPVHPKVGWAGMTDAQITSAINYILEQTFWPNTSS